MDSRLVLPVNTVLDGSYRIVRVVGSGGFGITYEAEDIGLGTMVAVKEYYPFDFGDRDATMSVRPKSDRHKQTFDWGRTNFLQEARTLARFEHPSIVRVTRVFETNATAYMVMGFEQGKSFDAWLDGLGRPSSQEELNSIIAPLLDALELMHAANFLHRDIAPDNIIVRRNGTPVLLDFGAARRAIAQMSRSLTGIVKAGYSPHEQYSSDGRLQGPWSDIYALGGTLYRAVTGRPPEEATLRFDEDRMATATQSAKGTYRREFLAAIDACLKVRHSERPRSVAQLRPMLLGRKSQPRKTDPPIGAPPTPATRIAITSPQPRNRWPAIAATVVIVGGVYGGIEFKRWTASDGGDASAEVARSVKEAEARRRAMTEATQQQAALDVERRRKEKEAADARQRQIENEEARRRKDLAEAQQEAEQAETRRRKQQAEAAEAEARRIDEAAVEEKRRIAALEEARKQSEADAVEKAKDESSRITNIPTADQRAEFVRRVRLVLVQSHCYEGARNAESNEIQEGLNKFIENAKKRGKSKPMHIELVKATVGDFESWLRDADSIKDGLCIPKAKPQPPKAKPEKEELARSRPQHQDPPQRRRNTEQRAPSNTPRPGGMGPLQGIQ